MTIHHLEPICTGQSRLRNETTFGVTSFGITRVIGLWHKSGQDIPALAIISDHGDGLPINPPKPRALEEVALTPGKTEVRIYDYVDREVPMLARMFEKRRRGYRAIGYVHGPARVSREELESVDAATTPE